jgi:hypothetical protein
MRKAGTLLVTSALLVSTLAFPFVASAKDACVSDNFGHDYVFRKIKSLKKPGQVTPLSGLYLPTTGGAFPIAGTALVRADLSVTVGILIHATSAPLGNTFTADWNGVATLAGTGTYDADGDYEPDGPITFTSVDCATLTIP